MLMNISISSQIEELFMGNFKSWPQSLKIFFHHIKFEGLIAGKYGCVGCKNGGRSDKLQGRFKIHTFVHQFRYALKTEKSGMSFIHMKNTRLKSHFTDSTHATDTKNDFLLNPCIASTTIKTMNNILVLFTVLINC